MRYLSTRGAATASGFGDILLTGLAEDGGLFMPASWPRFEPATIASFAGRPYAEVAFEVIRPFVGGEIADAELTAVCQAAYRTFAHPAVAPLRQLSANLWVLELFHGPTLARASWANSLNKVSSPSWADQMARSWPRAMRP